MRETGEELITSGHFAADEVERRIEALYLHWEELLEASANKGRRLEEARDHQKFNQEVDIANSCISEKVCANTHFFIRILKCCFCFSCCCCWWWWRWSYL